MFLYLAMGFVRIRFGLLPVQEMFRLAWKKNEAVMLGVESSREDTRKDTKVGDDEMRRLEGLS